MKKLINVYQSANNIDVALLIARVGIATLMLTHGWPKLEMLLSDAPVQFPALFGLSATGALLLAVFAEVVCSLLILVGLGTRLAAIPLIITMLVAVFLVHGADPFAKQEPGLLYLLPYTVLLLTGSGKYSLDYLLLQKVLRSTYVRTLSIQ
ncbi:DoxX family protein [Pontibacter korlensis]|uniref:DoxX family protein n=1 Tax=Pontibacter korlensis TaxID=400092 RepID=A0A0E3ZDJ7_9BACT|nr:DoxX family protein [Pontibacter korlensis]AKD02324.1 DoxX family protein [Pontibacter korlensis]